MKLHQGRSDLLRDGGWFALPNVYVDVLLKELHPHDFLVLLVLRRLTHGFQRESARIAQSRIADLSGLSRRSVQRALVRLTAAGHVVKTDPGIGRRSAEYALGEELDVELADQAIESPSRSSVTLARLPDATRVEEDVAASGGLLRVDSLTTLSTQGDASTGVVKERFKDTVLVKDNLSVQISQNWSAILEEMQNQTTAATFRTYLKGLVPLPPKNGEILIRARNMYNASWIASRLDRVVLRALEAVEPSLVSDRVLIVGPDGAAFPLGGAGREAHGSRRSDGDTASLASLTEHSVTQNPMEVTRGG